MTTLLKDKIVKTRKEQTCWGCAEKFEKGTSLRYITAVDGGEITSSYWCRICDVTWLENKNWNDDGIGFGEVKEFDGWFDNTRLLPRTY
ncbi:hypothetical protein EVU96_08950 [Bacillus infantis]|uniref:hypothetical protein n=1 Tax=Bacillus infantis TaxID=324767 RepID=UPI00101C1267|nr:hypothetical protein [Bacillus infantis]RYI30532.1 hypothetical protein EVU96_08950 [Bacillus infantis]